MWAVGSPFLWWTANFDPRDEKATSHITYLENWTHAVQHVSLLRPFHPNNGISLRHVMSCICNSDTFCGSGFSVGPLHANQMWLNIRTLYFCWKWGFPNNVPSGSSSSGCPLLIWTLSWGTTRSFWKGSTMKVDRSCLHRRMSAFHSSHGGHFLCLMSGKFIVLLPVRTGLSSFFAMANHDIIMWLSKLGESVCVPVQLLLFCDRPLRFS